MWASPSKSYFEAAYGLYKFWIAGMQQRLLWLRTVDTEFSSDFFKILKASIRLVSQSRDAEEGADRALTCT